MRIKLLKTVMPFFKKINFLLIGFSRPVFTLFLLYMTYLLIGSLLFVVLESTTEMEVRKTTVGLIRMTQAMINKLREANYSDDIIGKTFKAENHLITKLNADPDLHWYEMYGTKFFFSFILVSTIGYGNVTPNSSLGKIICIIYCMMGLPLHEITMRLLNVQYRGGLRKILKVGLKMFPRSRTVLIILGILFFLFWSAFFLALPAWLFSMRENWEYHHAFYFCFVSLTTIGFGDYVVGVSEKGHEDAIYYILSFTLTIFWLFFGLGFASMAINMLSYVMGLYTLDKLDSKCRKRSEAAKKLKDLLELIKELNWQLIKGKPDDFENWDEIESFRDLLAQNPQDVTPAILGRMLDVVMDLKEKAYDQVNRTQLARIPLSDLLRRVKDTLPEILSTDSFLVNEVETQHTRNKFVSPSLDPGTHFRGIHGKKAFSTTILSPDQVPYKRSRRASIPTNLTAEARNIIEDRTEYDEVVEADDADEKDLNPKNETEEKSDDESKDKD